MSGKVFYLTRSGCVPSGFFASPVRTAELIDNLQGGLEMLLKRRLSPPHAP